jgi:hypothetical protein
MENLEIIKEFVTKFKSTLCLTSGGTLVYLEGFTDIPDDDYFWMFYELGSSELIYCSCCINLIPLVLYLPATDYTQLDEMFKLNRI